MGAMEQALQLVASAEQQQPNNPAIQHRYGVVLLRLNRAHEAFAKFSAAIRMNPEQGSITPATPHDNSFFAHTRSPVWRR